MGKRKNDSLKRRVGTREYRNVLWISAEGQTEKDYFQMNVFRDTAMQVRFPKNVHPDRRNPHQVLKRFQKALRSEDFRKNDEAWVVVDVDNWDSSEFDELVAWAESDSRHHLAISNPKFELFLLMHFGPAKGCTTSQKVDTALKRQLPRYAKRISATQFAVKDVKTAIENAREKRFCCNEAVPAPGMTDAHLLAERLIEKR